MTSLLTMRKILLASHLTMQGIHAQVKVGLNRQTTREEWENSSEEDNIPDEKIKGLKT